MKRAIIICLFLLLKFPALGQNQDAVATSEALREEAHPEEIYLHYNTSLLFPGEYLLYKVYNLNPEDKSLSHLSKIAYVELLNKNGERLFSHKIMLDQGTGQGDFFVPTSIPSGSYKLVAYTNWMKNFGSFYQEDIRIINPYRGRKSRDNVTAEEPDASGRAQEVTSRSSDLLELKLQDSIFGQRERVRLRFIPSGKTLKNISVSVRKRSDLPRSNSTSARDFVADRQGRREGQQLFFLPELRGQLFQGRIVPVDSRSSQNLQRTVAISLPSVSLIPEMATTDAEGEFSFFVDKDVAAENAVLEVIGEDRGAFELKLVQNSGINPAGLKFPAFHITPDMKEDIINRSIHNQIENSYFSVKPDTLVTAEQDDAFYAPVVNTYVLDQYKRFETIPETFVEIVNSAWIEKENGKPRFVVRGLEGDIDIDLPPLVSIDGVFVQEHEDLVNLNAEKVKSIGIIRDKIYLGPEVFQGAILVQTLSGEYYGESDKKFSEKVQLTVPLTVKKYFRQIHSTTSERIPDYRRQLLWDPNLDVSDAEEEISFYTSDIPGLYEIVVEGFSADGKPVSIKNTIEVLEDQE